MAGALRAFVSDQVAERILESGGRLSEERRLVTALFADISGFTPLADRLDPEQLLEIIDPVVGALADVVARFEGYVEKFAGDALLAFFGAPVAHDDDAARALLVALEMRRRLAELLPSLPPDAAELKLHVGVNSGHVIARLLGSQVRADYALLGDTVILAQRLESATPTGEIYVGETTVDLTGQRFDFEFVGELQLKGKREPVRAWRLVGERSLRSSTGPRDRPLFVGRQRELEVVAGVLDDLAAGRGGILTVSGEAGVGKSTLTAAAEETARARGFAWLATRCLSYGVGVAYGPYVELIHNALGVPADTSPPALRERIRDWAIELGEPDAAPYLARMIGVRLERDDQIWEMDPEAFRRALHESVVRTIVALSRRTPLVLAIEDIHWADPSSIDLTRELDVAASDERVVLYLTCRPEGSALVDSFRPGGEPRHRSIALERLEDEAVRAIAAGILGGSVPDALEALLRDRAGGNPLFVREVVHSLQDSGVLGRRTDGGWRLGREATGAEVPPTIEGVLAARLDHLQMSAASVLQTASAIGRRVPIELLASVVPSDTDLPGNLAKLVDSGFLDRTADAAAGEVLVFHHALVQEVAYSRLLRRRREEIHRRVADEAERLYGVGDDAIDLLAQHLYLGRAGAKAITYLKRAGERACSLYANEEAITHYGRAVELAAGDVGEFNDLRMILAELYDLVGDYERAIDLYEALRRETNDLRAWIGLAGAHRKRGAYAEALALVDQALGTPELAHEDIRPLWLERGWSLSISGHVSDAIDAIESGLALGPRADPIGARLLLQLTRAYSIEGRCDEALASALEATEILEAHGEQRGLATALRLLGGDVYTALGRYDDAERTLQRALEIAERTGSAEEIGGCLINLGWVSFKRADLAEGIASTERAIETFERVGHSSGRAIGYVNLAEMLEAAGRHEEAFVSCGRALDVARSAGNEMSEADALHVMASIRLHQGRFGDALGLAQDAAARFDALGIGPTASECRAIADEARASVGRGAPG